MLCSNLLNSTLSTLIVFMRWGSFCVFRETIATLTVWSSVWFTFTRWQEGTSWLSSLRSHSWRNISFMMPHRPASSCLCSSSWIFWERKDVFALHYNTTSFYSKLTSMIPLPVSSAWIIMAFQANSMNFFSILSNTSVTISVSTNTAYT